MESVQSLFEKRRSSEVILSALFVIYLIMGFHMPAPLANFIDSGLGKVIVVLCALMLFAYSNPVLAVLGVFVAYKGSGPLGMFAPTEERKWQQFSPIHKFPYTLEQEVVKNMAPIVRTDLVNTTASFRPLLENLHDASSVNYNGPI